MRLPAHCEVNNIKKNPFERMTVIYNRDLVQSWSQFFVLRFVASVCCTMTILQLEDEIARIGIICLVGEKNRRRRNRRKRAKRQAR